jgi:hypothetical protein
MRVQGVAWRRDGSQPRWWRRMDGSRVACAHLTGRMQGPRLDAQPEDADGELDQFARRRCFNLSSGTSTLPGQPDEGSLAMGSSADGATSVRRGAIPTAKRRRLSAVPVRTVHMQLVCPGAGLCFMGISYTATPLPLSSAQGEVYENRYEKPTSTYTYLPCDLKTQCDMSRRNRLCIIAKTHNAKRTLAATKNT